MFSDKKSSSLRPLVMLRVKIYFMYHFIISSIEEDEINIIFSAISSFSLKTSCSTQLENPLENLQNQNLKISNYLFESINDSISTNNWFLQFHNGISIRKVLRGWERRERTWRERPPRRDKNALLLKDTLYIPAGYCQNYILNNFCQNVATFLSINKID